MRLTGLSGVGKSTLAHRLESVLRERSLKMEVLHGDAVRTNLSKGLGFSKHDWDANIQRIVCLDRIVPGGADRSYGIHVAQLAGTLPRPLVQLAQELLVELESKHGRQTCRLNRHPTTGGLMRPTVDGGLATVMRFTDIDNQGTDHTVRFSKMRSASFRELTTTKTRRALGGLLERCSLP